MGDIPSIHFHVKHRDSLQSESFGKLELPIQSFLHTPIQRRWYPLVMTTACDPKPVICLSAHYTCTSQTLYTSEVPYCAFPQRTACGLRLYADAHLDPEHPRPPVPTAEGTYRNLDLWNEMYTAIQVRPAQWEDRPAAPDCGDMRKPRKYPVFRIPPDTSIFPIFPSGYLDTRFFINGPVGKQVAFRKHGENGTCLCPIFHPFAPHFYTIFLHFSFLLEHFHTFPMMYL